MTDVLPAGSWTIFGLPRSHWHCQFENFQWEKTKPGSLRGELLGFIEAVQAGEAPHLILNGPPGIGKSHLGVSLYRWAVTEFGTLEAVWVNVPNFCSRVKASFDQGHPDPFEDYREARKLVVMDDLFGKKLSPYEGSQIIPQMIDIAHMNNAAMVFTMNPHHKFIYDHLDAHEASRIFLNSTIIPMTATQDWRLPLSGEGE